MSDLIALQVMVERLYEGDEPEFSKKELMEIQGALHTLCSSIEHMGYVRCEMYKNGQTVDPIGDSLK